MSRKYRRLAKMWRECRQRFIDEILADPDMRIVLKFSMWEINGENRSESSAANGPLRPIREAE